MVRVVLLRQRVRRGWWHCCTPEVAFPRADGGFIETSVVEGGAAPAVADAALWGCCDDGCLPRDYIPGEVGVYF